MKNKFYWAICLSLALTVSCSQNANALNQRTKMLLDDDWRFAQGNAADILKDFEHGTEYFTYLTKIQSNNDTRSPILLRFDDSSWKRVDLPHDWVVDLPYSGEASHSHGYKTVGWRYPETSVGWYRKHFTVSADDEGKRHFVQFEGIFRNAQVFCNGFLLGQEPSGYATQTYDITDCINYGADNVLTVRADASTEEGWYYEGAGIYRNVWLTGTAPVHVATDGTFVTTAFANGFDDATLTIAAKIANDGDVATECSVSQQLVDADGRVVATARELAMKIAPQTQEEAKQSVELRLPHLWDLENPYLYTLHTQVTVDGAIVDDYTTRVGLRAVEWTADRGLLLNGRPVKLKGTNMHLDHAGVGVAVPDELWRYRIARLKTIGSNAIRCSHNPASPSMLDICDEMGVLVIDETRQMGVNAMQLSLLRHMIERDRNHPSVFLWSVGNEEWAVENSESGARIVRTMCQYAHSLDSTRLATAGNAGGQALIEGLDIQGYNYIAQNDVDGLHERHPQWMAIGTEETSGCGTRGIYATDKAKGWMASHNRVPQREGEPMNVIERGWKFYAERPWLAGLFYWTGFDYRGEPNPLAFPATGSQFGIFDYCGFPKDEAFYLKAAWTDKPLVHLLPHWNLDGMEGKTVSVWAYSNCDEVELLVNGKSAGRKTMPLNGHLAWDVTYKPGKIEAKGFRNGKMAAAETVATTGKAAVVRLLPHKAAMAADGQDLIVVDVSVCDAKGREVPTALDGLDVSVDGAADILGWGNGDSGFKEAERPQSSNRKQLPIKAFNGKAQILLTSLKGVTGTVTVKVSGASLRPAELPLSAR